ncbi:MAG: YdcF family protein [Hyphomicrobiaceae bacterium]
MITWKHIVVRGAALVIAAALLGFLIFANATTRSPGDTAPRAAAIVALTGGAQRIRVAGRLLENRQAGRLLISGVNRVVSRAELRRMLAIDADLFSCCVDIDYAAQNTRGNAVETRKWAKKHEFDSLIVVTSSYHMPRSLTELGHLLPAVDLVAHPVVPRRFRDTPWWLDHENVLLLGAEYLKFLPSAAQFGLGRLMSGPKSKKDVVIQKAVAIQ